jgi:hypothetical protein
MNYLIYIEHAAENLQFFLWYQDYVKRFNALSSSERALSTEWTVEKAEAEAVAFANNNAVNKKISPEAAEMFKGTDFAQPTATVKEVTSTSTNPFHTPPGTPSLRPSGEPGWDDTSFTLKDSQKGSHQEKAANAFEAADVKFQPCKWLSIQSKLVVELLTSTSHYTTFQRGNLSYRCDLHFRRRIASAQPCFEGASCSTPCTGCDNASLSIPECSSHR